MDKPSISVCMITYNHQDFIEAAIEGVLNQETNVSIELIIANDASTDSTHSVIEKLLKTHPKSHLVKYTHHKINIGLAANFRFSLNEAKGKYIAICEGDDFWTDTSKLQKQVDFLEEITNCSFCFHQAYRIKDNLISYDDIYPKISSSVLELNESEFFKIASIPTASVVYRNIYKFPDLDHSHCDFMLYCSLMSGGKAGYIDSAMSVYRMHSGGVTHNAKRKWYAKRRLKELDIERRYKDYSIEVRNQINTVFCKEILYFLNSNRGSLTSSEKVSNFLKLITLGKFYKLPLKSYMRLGKTLIKGRGQD